MPAMLSRRAHGAENAKTLDLSLTSRNILAGSCAGGRHGRLLDATRPPSGAGLVSRLSRDLGLSSGIVPFSAALPGSSARFARHPRAKRADSRFRQGGDPPRRSRAAFDSRVPSSPIRYKRRNAMKRLVHAAALAALLAPWLASPAGAQTVEVSSAEGAMTLEDGSQLWFVEMSGPPTAEDGDLSAILAEQATFRAGASGIRYQELKAFKTLWNGLT